MSGKHLTTSAHLQELGMKSTSGIEVMHFCWTQNITTKIVKLKALRKLFVAQPCAADPAACGFEAPSFELAGACVLPSV